MTTTAKGTALLGLAAALGACSWLGVSGSGPRPAPPDATAPPREAPAERPAAAKPPAPVEPQVRSSETLPSTGFQLRP